ncbi:Hsp20/alpha crystallin family protein [Altererythrobacter lauratis]|uniref:Hsp20/alpha crystallin family protein n=1 Tax=Alteraurantiacibacter lauratis TaxID=2054627 RepID=A0ABV7EIP3_9SPHN
MTNHVTPASEQTSAQTLAEPARDRPVWRPLADILETADGFTLMLELPGVAAEDVEVSLDKRQLTIRARSQVVESDQLEPVHSEYVPGDYERAFLLSDDLDGEHIEAELKNGVLTVHVPRLAEARPRSITVKAA